MLEIIISADPTIQIILGLYLLGMPFCFGVTMAYLSRRSLDFKRPRKDIVDMYFIAFIVSIFSIAALPSVLFSPSFPEYGWKLWHGERPSESNKWYQKLKEAKKFRRHLRSTPQRVRTRAAGDCYSIWE